MHSYVGEREIPHTFLFQTTHDLHANKRVYWSYIALTGKETPLYFHQVMALLRLRLRPDGTRAPLCPRHLPRD